jgi:hypothetical protein
MILRKTSEEVNGSTKNFGVKIGQGPNKNNNNDKVQVKPTVKYSNETWTWGDRQKKRSDRN